jgi:hypothetical protein
MSKFENYLRLRNEQREIHEKLKSDTFNLV